MARRKAFVVLQFLVVLVGCGENDSATDPADLCRDVDCSGHGRCAVTAANTVVCLCDEGYRAEGLSCVPEAGPCEGVTCSGHGTCREENGEPICQCDEGYHAQGLECVSDADPCDGVDCSGHGVCRVEGELAVCECESGYRAEGLECVPATGRFPHARTFGFDYWYLGDDLDQFRALAERHDVIIGGAAWGDRIYDLEQYEIVKSLDPPGKLVNYFAYHSQNVAPGSSRDWMEQWAEDNGYRPEDIYCHYEVDTTLRITGSETSGSVLTVEPGNPPVIEVDEELFPGERVVISGLGGHPAEGSWLVLPVTVSSEHRYRLYVEGPPVEPADGRSWSPAQGGTFTTANGGYITVPGWPSGWAEKESDSRALARWNGGWPAICPLNEAWRRAAEQWVLRISTVRGGSAYVDGVFLDTFDGMVDAPGWDEHPENMREVRELAGGTPSPEEARSIMWGGLVESYLELRDFLRQQTGNPSFLVIANVGDVRIPYRDRPEFWMSDEGLQIDPIAIEFLATSTTGRNLIQWFQALYDDLENGRRAFIRSQTNFSRRNHEVPFSFKSFLLACEYLVLHSNGWYWVHEGSAYYGGYPAGVLIDTDSSPMEGTHWMPNQEVDIGAPVTRAGPDYWGQEGTDRFFDFAPDHPGGHVILAREFENALVLARFGDGGWDGIGSGATTVELGGTFYPLLEDNSTGPPVTEWTFGQSEGVILMKFPLRSGGR